MTRQPEAARRLAKALADRLADAELAPAAGELRSLADLVEGTPSLRSVLVNPAVPHDRRGALAAKVALRARLSEKVQRFIQVLASQDAVSLLPAVATAFAEIRDERRGMIKAEITSAQPLDAAQRQKLTAALARLTGRQITLEERTDPSLIGGVVARIGSTLYDGSLRSRLAGLRSRIAGS